MVERNCWLSVPDAFAALLMARAGFDSVTLDMQHGLFDERAVVTVLMALGAAVPRRLVRVLANDAEMIGKVLDAGADGVIVPMINSVADAAALAAACRYAPAGRRSFGPMLAGLRTRPGVSAGAVEAYAMIETREGLDAVAEIAAVPGVAGVFIGPNDLAISMGLGAGSDRKEPSMLAAFARIVSAAHEAGKSAGLFCVSAGYAREAAGIGFDFLTIASDTGALATGAARALAEFDA